MHQFILYTYHLGFKTIVKQIKYFGKTVLTLPNVVFVKMFLPGTAGVLLMHSIRRLSVYREFKPRHQMLKLI